MIGAALALAGTSMGLDIMAGVFGYFAGKEAAGIAESRARMIRMEADADATRYAESAHHFHATQKLAFLKSGVTLSGSPLDVLDETARVASENISAIRAGGEARALDAQWEGAQARIAGRNALIGGIGTAFKTGATAAAAAGKSADTAGGNRKDTGFGWSATASNPDKLSVGYR